MQTLVWKKGEDEENKPTYNRREKKRAVMQTNRWFLSPAVFFFFLFFSDMVDKFLWSVVLLLLYESHARRNASQTPRLSAPCLSFLGGRLGFDWKMQVKVYDTKYVTVWTSRLLSLALASDWSGRRVAKELAADAACGRCFAFLQIPTEAIPIRSRTSLESESDARDETVCARHVPPQFTVSLLVNPKKNAHFHGLNT